MKNRISNSILSILLVVCSSCNKKEQLEPVSELDSVLIAGTLVPLALALMTRVMDSSADWTIQGLLSKYLGSEEKIGDVSDLIASKLALQVGQVANREFQRKIKIDLNALEETLETDYVPGLAESGTQLVLMTEKANEIKNAMESNVQDPEDLDKIGSALLNYQSYILLSAIKISILGERLRLAKKLGSTTQESLAKLDEAMVVSGKKAQKYLEDLNSKHLEKYVTGKLLTYSFRESFQNEDFDVKFNLQYAYCAVNGNQQPECGPLSQTICKNDLDVPCLDRVKNEAKINFDKSGVIERIVSEYRKKIFKDELSVVLQKLNGFAK